jgi:hypothetical protein
MLLIILNSFILFVFYLNFSLNEEVLLFLTFSVFFFIFVKTGSLAMSKFLNTNRYKIFYKYMKIINVLNISLNKIKYVYYWTSLFDFILEVNFMLPLIINTNKLNTNKYVE